jgi:microtubule-associated protein, RP/EB family
VSSLAHAVMPVPRRVCSKCGVDKHIEVETLIRAKYQHNLEFAQFLKNLWETNSNADTLTSYDALAVRKSGKGVEKMPIFLPGGATAKKGVRPRPAPEAAPARSADRPRQTKPASITAATSALNSLRTENAALKSSIETVEREREFYYSKLRDVSRPASMLRACATER